MSKKTDYKLTFEEVDESQADVLCEFEKSIAEPKLYGKPLDLKAAIHEIRNNRFFFVKNEGDLVGTAAFHIREDGSCYISNMAVSPSWRGKGIARAVMKFLMEKCVDSWRIDLTTHPENFRSISLYESFGFVIESRKENYYGDGEPRLIMVKLVVKY